ncbi:MAG TPA: S8 family serine peptidase [Solirubrobacterales bacterium]|nr:S8 family serine peptidase [Solirubrobacterales bacterium]
MTRRLTTFAALTLLCVGTGQSSAGATAAVSPARGFVPRELIVKFEDDRRAKTVRLPASLGVRRAAEVLRRSPAVAYAAPNYLATASAPSPLLTSTGLPNDPGPIDGPPGPPGGWVSLQWNLLPWAGGTATGLPTSPGGIDAIGAWRNLQAAGRAGGRGIVVAVLDTGVAYRSLGGRFRRSPDFAPGQFVPGFDFVSGDRLPLDQNGHGTHVAGTIAEKTDNGIGLVGLAYGAKLMPIRVLDKHGSGEAAEIARGIRFAVAHGADVINMSFNFGCGKRVPSIDEELRRAYRAGVVTVASIGNLGAETCVSPPATGPRVIGVGGTTEGGCLGSYSLTGPKIDVVAPGGGVAAIGCPSVAARPIFQVTLKSGDTRRFGEPGSYIGTSMAAAHVSGLAALVLASRALGTVGPGANLVDRLTRRLRNTARDLGLPSTRQGSGLIDAARATSPLP